MLIAWDVVEESLGEAEFLWNRREGALCSHDHDLTTLWDRIEDRLSGAIDGIRVGGDEAIRRYLSEALDAGRVASTAYAIGADATPFARERLVAVWRDSDGDKLAALRRGAELVDDPRLLPALRLALADARPAATAALLEAGRFRRLDPGAGVVDWLSHESAELQRAAVAASRYAPHAIARDCVRRAQLAEDPGVRTAAIETGVFVGMREAWSACRSAVAAQADECRPLLTLVALLGSAADHAAVVAAGANEKLRRDAVWAIGFAGRRDGADICIDLIRQNLLPKLAGEAFCAITGLDLQAAGLCAANDDNGDGEDDIVVPSPDEALPLPDLAGITAWWDGARGRFDRQVRYLQGQAISPAALQAALDRGPLRRRPPIATELAIRSSGRYDVMTSAFIAEQRRQLAAFPSTLSSSGDPSRWSLDGWSPAP